MVNMKDRLRNPNYANSPSFARAYMTEAAGRIAALEEQLAEAVSRTGAAKALPATGPYVERLVRIFRDRPDDDGSAVVLQDYARAAIKAAMEAAE